MPHATDNLNGEKSSSQFISHLTSYPVVSDSIETFKSNQYGRKSLEIVDGAYNRFGKPVQPYLETPYAYAKPYAQKADELADSGLKSIESHFPIVKEDTSTIVDTTKGYVFWPVKYLADTWQDEYSKTAKHNGRGPGVSTSVIAIVSTELRMAADFFHAVANFLGPKYDEAQKKGSDYVKQMEDTTSKYIQTGKDKAGEAQNEANKTADKAKNEAGKTADKAKGETNKAADKVSSEANKTKDEANKKLNK